MRHVFVLVILYRMKIRDRIFTIFVNKHEELEWNEIEI